MNHKIKIIVNGNQVETLKDLLPEKPQQLKILFIAKTPAPVSVQAGHYFQGKQGTMFWNKLKDYKILSVKPRTYEDENLLDHNYGITDIVKVPRSFGNEPSNEEYKEGMGRILDLIKTYDPIVICFVYKKVLDNILTLNFNYPIKSNYGFNLNLNKYFGNSNVFVFPMPGTPCSSEMALKAMNDLKHIIIK